MPTGLRSKKMTDDHADDGGQQETTSDERKTSQKDSDGSQPKAAESVYTQADLDRILGERLAREKKKYADYDDLKAKAKASDEAAKEKQTTQEQIEQLRQDIADRDAQDIAEKQDLAVEKLHAKLVRGRMSDEDATALVEMIDPMRLLADGKPDSHEIDKVAKSLTKIGGRSTPDPDQGRRGGNQPPAGMSDLIRQGAKAKNKI